MTDDLTLLAFDAAPIGIIYSEHRIIRRANDTLGRMFGYTPAELAGQSFAVLYPSLSDFERIGAAGHKAMLASGVYQDERVMARRDGSLFWCHFSGRSLTADPFAKAVWAISDLSARFDLSSLSRRERDVALLACEGKTAKDMARTLGLSPRTVEACVARARAKLGVRNIAELVSRIVVRPPPPPPAPAPASSP